MPASATCAAIVAARQCLTTNIARACCTVSPARPDEIAAPIESRLGGDTAPDPIADAWALGPCSRCGRALPKLPLEATMSPVTERG
jgi:hypothetical protein